MRRPRARGGERPSRAWRPCGRPYARAGATAKPGTPALALGLVLAIALAGCAPGQRDGQGAPGAGPGGDRPNIVFLLTDDLDTRSISAMPRLQQLLAEEGTTFSSALVNVPLCCPSRATALRGQYAHNHGVLTNKPPNGGFQVFHGSGLERSTVATWLQAQGYRTALIGKYLNGYPLGASPTYVPPGWTEWHATLKGAAAGYDYTLNQDGRVVHYGEAPEDYVTDVLARSAAGVVERSRQERQPFFLYLSTHAPHSPATPAPGDERGFGGETAVRSPSFDEQDMGDKPEPIRDLPPVTPEQQRAFDDLHRKRLQSLQAVDRMIGGLVEELQTNGELENTYFFFTSDNGFHMGEHRLSAGKNTPYEEDIRVPLIVRGPGVPAGRTLGHLVGNTDFAPTFAELAGAPIPEFVDGRSLVPLLGGSPPDERDWRDAFLIEHGRQPPAKRKQAEPAPTAPKRDKPGKRERLGRPPGRRQLPPFTAVRTAEHLYVEYDTGQRELYDLASDPFELVNLSASADPALIDRLAARLRALRACAGADCRDADGGG